MAKTGKAETVLSNDGKTRLKGNVGSQSTLVTQAKPPKTSINHVQILGKHQANSLKATQSTVIEDIQPAIDAIKNALVNADLEVERTTRAMRLASNEYEDALASNPEWVKADKTLYDKSRVKSFEKDLAVLHKIEKEDPNIVKADANLTKASANDSKAREERERIKQFVKSQLGIK